MSNEEPQGSADGQPASPTDPVQLGLRQLSLFAWPALILFTSGSVALNWALTQVPKKEGALGYSFGYFFSSFMVNLAAAAAVYLTSYYLIRQWKSFEYKQLARLLVVNPMEERVRSSVSDCFREWSAGGIREYQSLRRMKWGEVIRSAEKTIDICVQGWDGIVKNHEVEWEEFFAKNGQVNLFLPYVPDSIEESSTLPHMAERLERSKLKQVDEIRDTYLLLDAICKSCSNASKVNLYPIQRMIWYCLFRVDTKVAYLSLFQHVHGPVTDSPTFEIWLDRYPATKSWIAKEINGLRPSPTPRSRRKAKAAEGDRSTS